jgi:hypothetical protein
MAMMAANPQPDRCSNIPESRLHPPSAANIVLVVGLSSSSEIRHSADALNGTRCITGAWDELRSAVLVVETVHRANGLFSCSGAGAVRATSRSLMGRAADSCSHQSAKPAARPS